MHARRPSTLARCSAACLAFDADAVLRCSLGIRRWRGVPLLARRSTLARYIAARLLIFEMSLVNLRDVVAASLEIVSTSWVTVLFQTLTASGYVHYVGSVRDSCIIIWVCDGESRIKKTLASDASCLWGHSAGIRRRFACRGICFAWDLEWCLQLNCSNAVNNDNKWRLSC